MSGEDATFMDTPYSHLGPFGGTRVGCPLRLWRILIVGRANKDLGVRLAIWQPKIGVRGSVKICSTAQ